MFKQIIKVLKRVKKAGGVEDAAQSMKTVARVVEVAVRGSEKEVEKLSEVEMDEWVVVAAPVSKLKEIVVRPKATEEAWRRVQTPIVESTTYFQVETDAPPVPQIKAESLQKLVTYFHVAADAPAVPIIPARFLKKTAASTPIKADIAITAPVQSAPIVKRPSPLRLVSTATSLDAILEEDEEEEEQKVEVVIVKEEVKVPVKKAEPGLINGKTVAELLRQFKERAPVFEVNWDDFDEVIEAAPAPVALDLSLYDIMEEDEE